MLNEEILVNPDQNQLKNDEQRDLNGLPISYILLPLIPSNLLSSNLLAPNNFNQNQISSLQQNNEQPLLQSQAVNAEANLVSSPEKDSMLKLFLIPVLVISSLLLAGYFGFNYINGVMTGKMMGSINISGNSTQNQQKSEDSSTTENQIKPNDSAATKDPAKDATENPNLSLQAVSTNVIGSDTPASTPANENSVENPIRRR